MGYGRRTKSRASWASPALVESIPGGYRNPRKSDSHSTLGRNHSTLRILLIDYGSATVPEGAAAGVGRVVRVADRIVALVEWRRPAAHARDMLDYSR